MKRLLLSILFSLYSVSALADQNSAMDGSGFCYECSQASYNQNTPNQQVKNLEDVYQAARKNIKTVNESLGFNEKCNNFADDTGLKDWGNFITLEMTVAQYPELYKGTDDLIESCKNFPNLKDEQKELVWVVILNAMVHLESSCNKKEDATGTYGTALGLLQLYYGHESEAAPGCRDGDAKTVGGTFTCGLSILNKQLGERQALFSNKAHWEVLRKTSRKHKIIQRALEQYKPCQL
ncbi:MAG: hypothetical protein ACXVCY_06485 [Pseudobdellovibrionaceae bacterium]